MITTIFGLHNWQFWVAAVIQLIFVFCILRGLGWICLSQLRFTTRSLFQWLSWQTTLLVTGLAVFSLTAWAFGEIHQRNWQWLVICLGGAASLWEYWQNYRKKTTSAPLLVKNKSDFGLIVLVVIGSALQLMAIATSGLLIKKNVDFYFTNAGDGMMHLAFARSLVTTYPPVRPEVANIPLQNYHFFTDLLIAEQARLFHLPISHLFFQFWPFFLATAAAILIVGSIQQIRSQPAYSWIGLILWFFQGEVGYLFSLTFHHAFNWNVATIENSADQFLNVPQMFAKVMIFAVYWLGLYCYHRSSKRNLPTAYGAIALLVAASTGYKIYFGLFTMALLIGWWVARGITAIHGKHLKKSLPELWHQFGWVVLGSCLAYLVLRSVSTGSGKLGWYPLVWPKLLISSDHLNLSVLTERLTMSQLTQDQPKIFFFDLVIIGVALLTMVGTKLIGMLFFFQRKNLSWYTAILGVGMTITSIIGLNTLQNPGGFNTYNFLLVAIQPLFLLSAIILGDLWHQKSAIARITVVAILLLGAIRPIANYCRYFVDILHHRPDVSYSSEELQALSWIATQTPTSTLIQAPPQSSKSRQNAFIAFFGQRPTYLGGEDIAQSHGIDVKSKRERLESVNGAQSFDSVAVNLHQLGIHYLYIERSPEQKKFLELSGIADYIVFKNDAATIVAIP